MVIFVVCGVVGMGWTVSSGCQCVEMNFDGEDCSKRNNQEMSCYEGECGARESGRVSAEKPVTRSDVTVPYSLSQS